MAEWTIAAVAHDTIGAAKGKFRVGADGAAVVALAVAEDTERKDVSFSARGDDGTSVDQEIDWLFVGGGHCAHGKVESGTIGVLGEDC